MPVTRDLMLLAAAALAWFAYAIIVGQTGSAASLPLGATRILALALSAILGVRLLGLLVFDVFVARIWGMTATSLVRFVVYALMSAAAVTLLLKEGLDFNVATVLTTSALLTAIIGLALQAPLSNFFSGVALQIERQLRIGDVVRVDNRWAQIENIGWRSMMARRDDGTAIIVPNTLIGGSALPLRQIGTATASEFLLPAPLSVPPVLMTEIIREAISGIAAVSTDHPIGIFLAAMRPAEGLADYGVQFFSTPVSTDERPLAGTVRLRLWYAYQRYGVALPRSLDYPDPPALAALAAASLDQPQAPIGDTVAALGAASRWRDIGDSERERLARSGRRLLFAPREPIRPPRGLDGSLAVVVGGTIRLIGEEAPSRAELEPPLAANADPGAASAWYADELQPVEQHLGYAIGPFARLAVRRAAAQTANPAELFQRLAPLIEKAADREAFLRNVPDEVVQDFGAGAVLRLHRMREIRLLPSALDHVELLAMPVIAGATGIRLVQRDSFAGTPMHSVDSAQTVFHRSRGIFSALDYTTTMSPSNAARQRLISALHGSGRKAALAITGGGSGAVGELLRVPGGSRLLIEAQIPYDAMALAAFLGFAPAQACSSDTAIAMAQTARARAARLMPAGSDLVGPDLVGLGATAALVSDRPRKGEHRFHIAFANSAGVADCTCVLAKGRRDRAAEEDLVSGAIVLWLARACGMAAPSPRSLLDADEHYAETVVAAGHAIDQLLAGELDRVTVQPDGQMMLSAPPPFVLFPGSFNPMHEGHLLLARVAEELIQQPVAFEISVTNVDKPPLAGETVRRRLAQFAWKSPVELTRAPTFLEKSRLFPGTIFVVGADTAERLFGSKYYGDDEGRMHMALEEIANSGARFLMAVRIDAAGRVRALNDIPVPRRYADLFTEIPEHRFRFDTSSSEIRARGRTVGNS